MSSRHPCFCHRPAVCASTPAQARTNTATHTTPHLSLPTPHSHRSSGPARQVLNSLSGALPGAQYMSLQQHLMAKGLLRELEVPAEFEE